MQTPRDEAPSGLVARTIEIIEANPEMLYDEAGDRRSYRWLAKNRLVYGQQVSFSTWARAVSYYLGDTVE